MPERAGIGAARLYAPEPAQWPFAAWRTGHPEWWSLAIAAVAWIALAGGAAMPATPALCLAPLDRTGGFGGFLFGALGGGMLGGWTAMTLAMAPALAIPLVRHVAVRSFADRRTLAVAEFLAGALLAWMIAGLAVVAALSAAPRSLLADPRLAGLAFLAAALWQFAPARRGALRRCHRTAPLSPRGWRADRDCAARGLAYGRDCVTACGPTMIACLLAPGGALLCLCVQLAALAERAARDPRPSPSAIVLALCGAVAAAPAPDLARLPGGPVALLSAPQAQGG